LGSPATNGLGSRLQFHSQRRLLHGSHTSLELATDRSMPRQSLEMADVLYREMGFQ
jgi:hypothetical protein